MALKSALSSKVQEESLVVLDSMTMDAYKTKTVAAMLNALGAEKKALIVLPSVDQKLIKIPVAFFDNGGKADDLRPCADDGHEFDLFHVHTSRK